VFSKAEEPQNIEQGTQNGEVQTVRHRFLRTSALCGSLFDILRFCSAIAWNPREHLLGDQSDRGSQLIAKKFEVHVRHNRHSSQLASARLLGPPAGVRANGKCSMPEGLCASPAEAG
jgi:hypothetical protein